MDEQAEEEEEEEEEKEEKEEEADDDDAFSVLRAQYARERSCNKVLYTCIRE